MKNTLTDLNNYLFETLERLTDDSLSEEELKKEIVRSEAVAAVAETVIKNGELAFKVVRHKAEYGTHLDKASPPMPPMLEAK